MADQIKKIIATWICLDTPDNATYFPSAKGNSSVPAVQEIYWRCICCFFTLARYYNPEATLALFSNVKLTDIPDNNPVVALLKQQQVQLYTTPFEFITPPGYYEQWRNQFYEFSIFKFISGHPDFNATDLFILLDADCAVTGDLKPVFDEIQRKTCITYIIDYKNTHVINGCSRIDMQNIFSNLLNKSIDHLPNYHGGEFYASTINFINSLSVNFETLWPQLLQRHDTGLINLFEEAHVLSFLFYKLKINGGEANQFIKRLWTDPSTFRNIQQGDERLLIWHLPAEKRKGFKALFHWLKARNFILTVTDDAILRKFMRNLFGLPVIHLSKKPKLLVKILLKKIVTGW